MKEIILNTLEELETKKKVINTAQKKMLKEKYNFIPSNFNYVIDDYNSLIVKCSEKTYEGFLFYLGFEYEKESLEVLIKVSNKVIFSYSGLGRVEKLIEQLEQLEEVSV